MFCRSADVIAGGDGYNTFNAPVRTIDANGLVTEYEYNADGLVTAVTRRDGAETLASVTSTTDGVTTRYEYDAAGRLVREGNN